MLKMNKRLIRIFKGLAVNVSRLHFAVCVVADDLALQIATFSDFV